MGLLSDINFLMKLIAMVIDIVISVLWLTSDTDVIPLFKFSGRVLFYHAVGGYLVVLIVFVLLYAMDEPPGQWAQRLFIITGIVLFLIAGILGLLNALDDKTSSHGMLVAILLICIGALFVVDVIKSEGII